jgi:hypothetical protein
MGNNAVVLQNNGIILVSETGYQTSKEIAELNNEVGQLAKRLSKDEKPVLILADTNLITGHDQGAEAEAMKTLKIPFDAMAICTRSKKERLIFNMLLLTRRAQLSRGRVRTFKTVEEAEAWLNEFIPTNDSGKLA